MGGPVACGASVHGHVATALGSLGDCVGHNLDSLVVTRYVRRVRTRVGAATHDMAHTVFLRAGHLPSLMGRPSGPYITRGLIHVADLSAFQRPPCLTRVAAVRELPMGVQRGLRRQNGTACALSPI